MFPVTKRTFKSSPWKELHKHRTFDCGQIELWIKLRTQMVSEINARQQKGFYFGLVLTRSGKWLIPASRRFCWWSCCSCWSCWCCSWWSNCGFWFWIIACNAAGFIIAAWSAACCWCVGNWWWVTVWNIFVTLMLPSELHGPQPVESDRAVLGSLSLLDLRFVVPVVGRHCCTFVFVAVVASAWTLAPSGSNAAYCSS